LIQASWFAKVVVVQVFPRADTRIARFSGAPFSRQRN
jgi:hypothetical protein